MRTLQTLSVPDDGAQEDSGTSSDSGESLIYGNTTFETISDLLRRLERRYDFCGGEGAAGGYWFDLGAGDGTATLAAAVSRAWEECGGVEVVPDLHSRSVALERVYQDQLRNIAPEDRGGMASGMNFLQGDLRVLEERLIEPVDLLFAHATCFDDVLMESIARDVVPHMKPGLSSPSLLPALAP